jgi:hypothetical protein
MVAQSLLGVLSKVTVSPPFTITPGAAAAPSALSLGTPTLTYGPDGATLQAVHVPWTLQAGDALLTPTPAAPLGCTWFGGLSADGTRVLTGALNITAVGTGVLHVAARDLPPGRQLGLSLTCVDPSGRVVTSRAPAVGLPGAQAPALAVARVQVEVLPSSVPVQALDGSYQGSATPGGDSTPQWRALVSAPVQPGCGCVAARLGASTDRPCYVQGWYAGAGTEGLEVQVSWAGALSNYHRADQVVASLVSVGGRVLGRVQCDWPCVTTRLPLPAVVAAASSGGDVCPGLVAAQVEILRAGVSQALVRTTPFVLVRSPAFACLRVFPPPPMVHGGGGGEKCLHRHPDTTHRASPKPSRFLFHYLCDHRAACRCCLRGTGCLTASAGLLPNAHFLLQPQHGHRDPLRQHSQPAGDSHAAPDCSPRANLMLCEGPRVRHHEPVRNSPLPSAALSLTHGCYGIRTMLCCAVPCCAQS